MSTMRQLQKRRDEILQELAGLGPMRPGSVYGQKLSRTKADGTTGSRGPYPTYTRKRGGKTCGKRLHSAEEADLYRRQIEAFRRFEKLSKELVAVSEQMADLEAQAGKGKKNSAN